MHLAVDTLGHLLALSVTAADAQDRAQVADLTARVQEVTDDTVEENLILELVFEHGDHVYRVRRTYSPRQSPSGVRNTR